MVPPSFLGAKPTGPSLEQHFANHLYKYYLEQNIQSHICKMKFARACTCHWFEHRFLTVCLHRFLKIQQKKSIWRALKGILLGYWMKSNPSHWKQLNDPAIKMLSFVVYLIASVTMSPV